MGYTYIDMQKIELRSTIYKYHHSELNAADTALIATAHEQTLKSYAPYSGFYVGAALRMDTGEIFTGNNQENAAYPMCLCGERVALYSAGNARPNQPIETLAIVVTNDAKDVHEPAAPCGACRQVISEFESRCGTPIRLLLKADGDDVLEISSVQDILPLGFNAEFLRDR